MNRQERIRFFITEQCRKLDPTFRSCVYPKQIFLGDTQLPLLEGSSLTFRVNSNQKISFRIRLASDERLNGEPLNVGIPLSQVESISMKEQTRKHPEHAILFLLKNQALERLMQKCTPFLPDTPFSPSQRRMSKYLTVILGMDPNLARPNPVYCRVMLLANKFTFPFGTAKKIFMKDLPIMWKNSLEQQIGRRVKTGVHHDRERMAEMDDDAWDWLMSYLNVRWESSPYGGLQFSTDKIPQNNENYSEVLGVVKLETPLCKFELPDYLLEEEVETSSSPMKRRRYGSQESPKLSSSSSSLSV